MAKDCAWGSIAVGLARQGYRLSLTHLADREWSCYLMGAGMNIALDTNLRIASDTARSGEVFRADGGGMYFLARLGGTAKAMR